MTEQAATPRVAGQRNGRGGGPTAVPGERNAREAATPRIAEQRNGTRERPDCRGSRISVW